MAAESPAQRVARLLAEGLELFGEDRVDQAVACWRMVLELDPTHSEARDYLESAGVSVGAGDEARARVAQALALSDAGEAEQALTLLAAARSATPDDLEAQAAYDLLRAHLYLRYRARMQDGNARPRLCVEPEQLLRFDLPPEAGFLLSMLDGRMRIAELVTVSGLDPFAVLQLLARLEHSGIVELAA
jgi:tetratricopeptide (TPR) repeat protein